MAIMDLPELDPLFKAIHALLKPAGRFVFSVSHPCFNSPTTVMTSELADRGGKMRQVHGVKITDYLQVRPQLVNGILHQPEPHFAFHRPLSVLLGHAFGADFVVDAFKEPAYSAEKGGKNVFSWKRRPQIPPAIVVRLIKKV